MTLPCMLAADTVNYDRCCPRLTVAQGMAAHTSLKAACGTARTLLPLLIKWRQLLRTAHSRICVTSCALQLWFTVDRIALLCLATKALTHPVMVYLSSTFRAENDRRLRSTDSAPAVHVSVVGLPGVVKKADTFAGHSTKSSGACPPRPPAP